jgi:hypothetical protein
MCFSEAHSLAAAVVSTAVALVLPRLATPRMALFYSLLGLFWAAMEWLQFIGYQNPTNTVVPYAATVHIIVQPVAFIALATAVARSDRAARSGAVVRDVCKQSVARLAALSAGVLLLRLAWGEPTLPCKDAFCSLLDDATPRCLLTHPHMTWSVPLRTLPTGLYGTIHLATHHFVFTMLTPLVVFPQAALLFWTGPALACYVTGIPLSWLDCSVFASVWCYTGVLGVVMFPTLDRIVTAVLRRGEPRDHAS